MMDHAPAAKVHHHSLGSSTNADCMFAAYIDWDDDKDSNEPAGNEEPAVDDDRRLAAN